MNEARFERKGTGLVAVTNYAAIWVSAAKSQRPHAGSALLPPRASGGHEAPMGHDSKRANRSRKVRKTRRR
jgi:hypothetical protein